MLKAIRNKILINSLVSNAVLVTAFMSGQANAWVQRDARFKLCNDLNWSLQVRKVGEYQMNTNNDHSANQVVEAHSCVFIDFWAKFTNFDNDLDDAMDFEVLSNGQRQGFFTIYVSDNPALSLYFSIRNQSNFIYLDKSGVSEGEKIYEGLITFR